jgi:hypothetical protein
MSYTMHCIILRGAERAESPVINSAGQRPAKRDTRKREALKGRNPLRYYRGDDFALSEMVRGIIHFTSIVEISRIIKLNYKKSKSFLCFLFPCFGYKRPIFIHHFSRKSISGTLIIH